MTPRDMVVNAYEKTADGLLSARRASVSAYKEAQNEGFFEQFDAFNADLCSALCYTDLYSDADNPKDAILVTAPNHPILKDPKVGFKHYNSLAFWLGLFEVIGYTVARQDPRWWLTILWKGALGYFIAYTLFWAVTCKSVKRYMFVTLSVVVLYLAFNLIQVFLTFSLVLPALVSLLKAAFEVAMLYHGHALYKEVMTSDGGGYIPAEML
jgi:hypothetical protein